MKELKISKADDGSPILEYDGLMVCESTTKEAILSLADGLREREQANQK